LLIGQGLIPKSNSATSQSAKPLENQHQRFRQLFTIDVPVEKAERRLYFEAVKKEHYRLLKNLNSKKVQTVTKITPLRFQKETWNNRLRFG
jgi:hypothetical protein